MSGKKRVLVVDDSEFMRMMIKDVIKAIGYEVAGECDNGEDAVTEYEKLKPDLVTIDLVMPKASGIDGLKGIMAKDPKAKVIVVSAVDQRQSLMEAIKSGAKDFIVKPFDEERIESAIKKAVGDA